MMLAIDTSSLIAFLEGDPGPNTPAVEWALDQSLAAIPPVVLSELLSDPTLIHRRTGHKAVRANNSSGNSYHMERTGYFDIH